MFTPLQYCLLMVILILLSATLLPCLLALPPLCVPAAVDVFVLLPPPPPPPCVFCFCFCCCCCCCHFPPQVLHWLWPGVIPGGYAVVGAAAFTASVSGTVSVAVIVFELTNQMSYAVPVLLSGRVEREREGKREREGASESIA